jgi:hypothetical protein
VNKPKPKFSPKMAKVLGKIDANTRCIAKLSPRLNMPPTWTALSSRRNVASFSGPLFSS